ncbi:MAG TPA: hypothetical protein VN493_07250 [Thermoanaerobaculia bacterium]|nr:hypothetical protein [Thermoanaerobaculia bacterium]
MSAERPPVENARIVDGRGRFLVPGLIDSHVHVGMPPGVLPDFEQRHPAILAAYWKQAPRSYLYHGVTGVVDFASPPGSVERFRSAPLAPDLFACAPLILEERPRHGRPAVFPP